MKDLYADEKSYAVANSHYLRGRELLRRCLNSPLAQEALDEFETAADMGHVRAMYYAGAIHDSPKLDAKCTDAEGYEWLAKAAESGEPGAAELLYDHYRRGMYRFDSVAAELLVLCILAICGYSRPKKGFKFFFMQDFDGKCRKGRSADIHHVSEAR